MNPRIALIPVALALIWFAISMSRSWDDGARRPAQLNGEEPRPAGPGLTPGGVGEKTESQPAPATLVMEPTPEVGRPATKPFAYERELTTYAELKRKVFLTDDEKAVRQALLKHALLLRALGDRLREATGLVEVAEEQDAGIDLLLEALKDGDSELAAEILEDVVRDDQIEDTSLDQGVREQLAGVKAEILYHWTAINPDLATRMPGWLPGPVSQKIWDNVNRFQQANLAQSAHEATTRTR